MSDIYDWDIAAANNNDAPPNGAPEFMEYDQVNNTMREQMAVVARWQEAAFSGIQTAGSQPAYTLTSGQTLGAYANGQMFAFRAHATSTGSVTLNVDGLGAVAVMDGRGVQLGSGDILANGVYFVVKTAASWRLVGHLSAASVQALATVTLSSAPTTTNVSNAYSLTITNFPTAYANGQLVAFVANAANTGAATININSLGAEALQDPDGAALAANDIVANQVHIAARVSGAWRVFAGLPVNLATQVVGTLPVANGGTNATTAAGARASLAVLGIAADLSDVASAATAFANIKQAASDTATGVIEIAVQSEMETATDVARAVVPGRQHFHPGHPKAGGSLNGTGTPAMRTGDYGIGAITDNGTGNYTIALDTAFNDTNYWFASASRGTSGITINTLAMATADAKTTSALTVTCTQHGASHASNDSTEMGFSLWGDYA